MDQQWSNDGSTMDKRWTNDGWTINQRLITNGLGSTMDQPWIIGGSTVDQRWINYRSTIEQRCINDGLTMDYWSTRENGGKMAGMWIPFRSMISVAHSQSSHGSGRLVLHQLSGCSLGGALLWWYDELRLAGCSALIRRSSRTGQLGCCPRKVTPRIAVDRKKVRASWRRIGLLMHSLQRCRSRRACVRAYAHVICGCVHMYMYMCVHTCICIDMHVYVLKIGSWHCAAAFVFKTYV